MPQQIYKIQNQHRGQEKLAHDEAAQAEVRDGQDKQVAEVCEREDALTERVNATLSEIEQVLGWTATQAA